MYGICSSSLRYVVRLDCDWPELAEADLLPLQIFYRGMLSLLDDATLEKIFSNVEEILIFNTVSAGGLNVAIKVPFLTDPILSFADSTQLA